MALLPITQITKAGVTPSYAAVSASDTITVDSQGIFLHVKNAGGSSDTVTLNDSGLTPGGSTGASPTISVAATTGDKMIYIPVSFANPSTGQVTISHSFTTSVTCAVFRVV